MLSPLPPEDLLDYVLIDSDKLQARIQELGTEISAYYDSHTEPLMLVGILKGSMLFMSDMMRHVTVPHIIDFMDVTSYGVGKRESTKNVRILMDLHTPIRDKNVLIVEDIIDSGRTLHQVLEVLRARHPASLRVCTLLDKAERREVPITVDHVGFTIPNVFVFGYGLDIDEYYRNIPYIGVVKPDAVIPE